MPTATSYTFGGWLHGNATWNFETGTVTGDMTLTANWTAPATPVELDLEKTNLVSTAVAHVNANPGVFILAIGDDVTSRQNILNQADTNLTVVGLGEPQEIRFTTTSNSQRLFGLDGDTVSLTLGNNVTLVGWAGNTNDLIRVRNDARLYMYGTSRITGHRNVREGGVDGSGAAIQVRNGGTFTMRGGIITGNRSTSTAGARTALGGGVNVHYTGIFNMEGGEIVGNYRYGDTPADLVFTGAGVVSLSGTATVTRLVINHYDSHITIGSDQVLTAGLWSMPLPTEYVLDGWQRPDGTAWNFDTDTVTENITFTAQWTAPATPVLELRQ